MTSTVPIAQTVPPANAVPAERAGRSKTAEQDAFSGLLSKMTSRNQDAAGADANAEGEAAMPDGEHGRRPFMWVAASAEILDAEAVDAAALLADSGSEAGDAPVASHSDPLTVMQPATAASGVAAAVADIQAVPGHEGPPLPGNGAWQMPASASGMEVTPQEKSASVLPRETVNITILKQETHFAPVAAATLAGRTARPVASEATDLAGGLRPSTDKHAGARVVRSELTEGGAPGTTPLIPGAVHGTAGSGRYSGSPQRGPMNGSEPLNATAESGTTNADASASGAQRVVNVGSEVSAEGVTTSSAVQLIAERIASEAATEVARPNQPGQATFTQTFPLKVLHIQLQPADLGTVTVRMSLKEKTLQLDLEVSRGETAQLLQRDKEALSSLLRSAGYLVEGMDVRITDPSPAASQSATGGAQPGPQMQGGGQPGFSNPDARSTDGRRDERAQRNTFGDERYGTDGQVGEPSRGSGVYV